MAGIDKLTEERKVKRLRYFDGLFLRQEEFNLEQSYHLRMRRLHNRQLHTCGIVSGLDVLAEPADTGKVTLTPGLALLELVDFNREEGYSQEVLLSEEVELDLAAAGYQSDQTVYLYLSLVEEKADVVDDRGGSEKIHWWEKPVVEHRSSADPSAGKLLLSTIGFKPTANGQLVVDPAKIDYRQRIIAGAYGPVTLSIPQTEKDLPVISGIKAGDGNGIMLNAPVVRLTGALQMQEVQVSAPEPKTLQMDGSLAIHGDLTVNGNTTTINTHNLQVEDNVVVVNRCSSGSPPPTGGLEVFRGAHGGNAQLLWNEEQGAWVMGTTGGLVNITALTDLSVVDIHRHEKLYNQEGSPALQVDATGQIGIGTATPTAPLEVAGQLKARQAQLTGELPALRLTGSEHIEPGTIEEFKHLTSDELERLVSKDWLIREDHGLLKIGIQAPDERQGIKTLFTIDSLNGIVKAAAYEGDGSHLSGLVIRWLDVADGGGIFYPGKVGIGTDHPQSELEVQGTVSATAFVGDGSKLAGIGAKWRELPDERLFYPGKIGIGVEQPETHLDLKGTLTIRNDDGTPTIAAGNGRIGIGTIKPTADLEIAGKQDCLTVKGSWNGDGASPVAKIVADSDTIQESGTLFNQKRSAEQLNLLNVHYQGESRLVVRDNGNVGIGIDNPTLKFQVMGDATVSDNFYVRNIYCSGNLVVSGAKSGYVVDQFINRLEEPVEEGDVVVISATQNTLYYGLNNNIPIPEIDLATQMGDRRVCGIVSEVLGLPQAEGAQAVVRQLSPEELNGQARTQVAPGQIGLMVTLGAFAHCKVDADLAPIEVGDLLISSPTKGHAQKALKPEKVTGAIVGKALAALPSGKGKIPVMVTIK